MSEIHTATLRTATWLLALSALWGVAEAGQDRIPDALARAGRSVEVFAPPGSGSFGPRRLETLLARTDVIVKGRLVAPHAHLSDDQTQVLTDYVIDAPEYLYAASVSKPTLPPPTRVTLKGGSVTINGLTYTATYRALPLPAPGTECLLLLLRLGERYYPVGYYDGVFPISADRVRQVAKGPDFLKEYRDVPASKAIASIVARRVRLGQ